MLVGGAVAVIGAQSARKPDPNERKPQAPPKVVTLTGCVEKGSTPNQYTITDDQHGRYEVSGNDIRKYLGQRVQVAGNPGSTRFRVKGGLYPTPNAAGQAGAIDPGRAAIAAQPGGGAVGTGNPELPTFKVKAVRQLDGACE